MKRKYEDMAGRPKLLVPVIDERSQNVPVDALTALVYGYLLYRLGNPDPRQRSRTRTDMSSMLRLDKKAVDRSVAVLVQGGAAIEEGARVRAIQPTGCSKEWFRQKNEKTGDDWREWFINDHVYLPRSSTVISVKTNMLFWHLVKLGNPVDRMPGYLQVGGHADDAMKYLSAEYLAKGLRCYRKTVTRGLTRLKSLGLITIQRTGRKSIVVGIPPIGTKADLWRNSWKGARKVAAVVEVTAQSLFGVPSDDPLARADPYEKGTAMHMRCYGIKGKLAEELITKIVKYRVIPSEWQTLLAEAKRDHDRNLEKEPGRFPVKHCGYLFQHMLDDFLKEQAARTACSARPPMGSSEMFAGEMLEKLRLTTGARGLLREALRSEQFDLRGGGCVPCRLNWDTVLAVLKHVGNDFVAFRQGIAELIFSVKAGKPQCDWYDKWMAIEQIPVLDDTPMNALKLDVKTKRNIRVYAGLCVQKFYEEADEVPYKHLMNNVIRLACWQAATRTAEGVENRIDEIKQVLLNRTSADAGDACLTEAEEMSLLA